MPTPRALALAITADASPVLRLRGVFGSDEEARQFAAQWPSIVGRWRSLATFLGLGSALDGLRMEQKGTEVELAGRIAEAQLRLALALARNLVPQHGVDGSGQPR
jgi:hypothetical protein